MNELQNIINKQNIEISNLKHEINTLKEKLKMYIPRRDVRAIYKHLGKILNSDIDPQILEEKLKSKE